MAIYRAIRRFIVSRQLSGVVLDGWRDLIDVQQLPCVYTLHPDWHLQHPASQGGNIHVSRVSSCVFQCCRHDTDIPIAGVT